MKSVLGSLWSSSFGGSVLLFLFFLLPSSRVEAGIDLAVYGELPFNRALGIPIDLGTGPGHGIVFFQYTDQKHFGKGNQFRAGLNTETAWVAFDINATSSHPLMISPYLKGQFGFAEMVPDYISAGQQVDALSFFGLYFEAGFDWRYRLFRALSLRGNVAFRQWFFLHRGDSETAGLRLPANSPALHSEWMVAWEQMDTWRAKGRLMHGFRAYAGATIRRRFVQLPWGGLNTAVRDLRNQTPSQAPAIQLTAFAQGAYQVHSRISLALDAMVGWGWFADDIYRFKIGGDNPYVPMISGTYFAEFCVDGFVLAHLKALFLPTWWLRITPQVDVAWIPDPLRKGNPDESRWILGIGLAFDFFLRDGMWFHLKAGYAPNAPRPERDGGFKVMVGFIASWWS